MLDYKFSITLEQSARLTAELMVQLYDVHIPIQDKSKRCPEALSDCIYPPDSSHLIDHHYRQISDKIHDLHTLCNRLKTIKIYLLNTSVKQKMTNEIEIAALSNEIQDCWPASSSLKSHCKQLVCIPVLLDKLFCGVQGFHTSLGAGKAPIHSLFSPQ
jgi:hypothetical protein